MGEAIEKVSIIISKGSLEGVYPGLDHGQRCARRGDRSQSLLHVLRPRRHPQKAARAHQGGRCWQPGHAHGKPDRCFARHVGHRDPHDGEEDGAARHPGRARVHGDDRRYWLWASTRARPRWTCSASPRTTSSTRSKTSSPWVSSMGRPPAGRSSSLSGVGLRFARTGRAETRNDEPSDHRWSRLQK